ncbi:hypothetical protein FB45DRAFT_1035772 [Roridomyces roridus]|uniref:2'-5' RNA ligase family protein n=1 Tax=Roridomyces roridus TaxID=1738132 RepID=A0AAD7FC32_9AGAR|nr:hypothetical protein FB45DRAFT_1035772 [Roridomyces roridus]
MRPTIYRLFLQLTLAPCKDYFRVDDMHRALYPGHAPAHVSVFQAFDLPAEDYPQLLAIIDTVAANSTPFTLKFTQMWFNDTWIALNLADDESPVRDRFKEIVGQLERWIPAKPSNVPHFSIYKNGSGKFPDADRRNRLRVISNRAGHLLSRLVYEMGAALTFRVTGLELLQYDEIIRTFPFYGQGFAIELAVRAYLHDRAFSDYILQRHFHSVRPKGPRAPDTDVGAKPLVS